MVMPARLVLLECPQCGGTVCIFHTDFLGPPLKDNRLQLGDRAGGVCSKCAAGAELRVKQQAPHEFFFQPDSSHAMSQAEFDYWVGVLRAHHPEHAKLKELGTTWYAGGQVSFFTRLKWWLFRGYFYR